MNVVLIVGSAPDAVRINSLDLSLFSSSVAINNAWKLRQDLDYAIYPEDFPTQRQPKNSHVKKKIITAKEYVPIQNKFGGFVYAGGTMAFTAGYWALGTLNPDVIAYLGCDMIYSDKVSDNHFYGKGAADPLRDDITLQSLEAKSARLMAIAKFNNCSVVNLSEQDQSRLLFPRVQIDNFKKKRTIFNFISADKIKLNLKALKKALSIEKKLNYMVHS
ncbi:MAG: hypothetical protein RJA85_529, partial [Pseudomonadota bacterium]